MNIREKEYWDERYEQGRTGWDIGYASTPLREYFDQVENKEMKILIPGCGNAYEAAYLHEQGFKNVYVIDISNKPLEEFANANPSFPEEHVVCDDFFSLTDQYDIIVEQTFFCALPPEDREKYAQKVFELLKPEGKLVGLFFDREFDGGPPYGGTKEEYIGIFRKKFELRILDTAYNSIKPRQGTELFAMFVKK